MTNYNDMWLHYKDEETYEIRDPEMPIRVISELKVADLDPQKYAIDYGKYQGMNLLQINQVNASYLNNMYETTNDVLLKQCLAKLI